MPTCRSHRSAIITGLVCFLPFSKLPAADATFDNLTLTQNATVAGDVTVSGAIGATGRIDSAYNSFRFGTQSSVFANEWLYTDADTDTLTNTLNRATASWLWRHLATPSGYLPAMRLTSAHHLLLYKADGTTAGVTLKPETTELLLGTAQLTATGTTLSTNGHFSVGGDFTVNHGGAFRSGANLPLNLSPSSSNQPISLSTAGTGDIVFNTGGFERVRIESTGNVGVGTTSPAYPLTVRGTVAVSETAGGPYAFMQGTTNVAYFGSYDARRASFGNAENWETIVADNGNVGIGTTNPQEKLEVAGGSVLLGNSTGVKFKDDAGGTSGYLWYDHVFGENRLLVMNAHPGGGVHFFAGGGSAAHERLTIQPGGNVGLGTTSPGGNLHVTGVGNPNIRVESSNGGSPYFSLYQGPTERAYLQYFENGAVDYLDIHSGGHIFLNPAHNVGIGTTSPGGNLHVTGVGNPNIRVESSNGGSPYFSLYQGPTERAYLQYFENGAVDYFDIHSGGHIFLNPAHNVGIGTTSPTHKLAVNGTIRANEVIVDTGWADYVFEDDYRLAPLSEVEAHIRAKKHLPGIPSAAEVEAHGVSMGEMQSKLLAKVEELTLHLIRMEKENAALRREMQALKAER